jgi:hypothetical protein
MSKNDSARAASAGFTYQDDVNIGLDRKNDIEAAPEEDDPASDGAVGAVTGSVDPAVKIQMGIHKVSNK